MVQIVSPDGLEYSEVNLIIHAWTFEIPVGEFGHPLSHQKYQLFKKLDS